MSTIIAPEVQPLTLRDVVRVLAGTEAILP